jgi:hypothetical protein
MNDNWHQDSLLHLGDALADEIANTATDALLAEVAEDFGDRRALVNRFDNAFARAHRRSRRWRIAAALRNIRTQVSRLLFSKPAMASAGTLAATVFAVVVYQHRIAPVQVAPEVPIATADYGRSPQSNASPGGGIVAGTPSPPPAPAAPAASAFIGGDAERNRVSGGTVSSKLTEPRAEAGAPQGNLRWPAQGRLISSFGQRTENRAVQRADRKPDDGINIAVPEGSNIHAAADGVVSYVGSDRTFGNLMLVRHDHGFSTAYGHASEVLVKVGDAVRRGQVIAKAGHTGDVGQPQLYFEVRKETVPVDPMPYLSRD